MAERNPVSTPVDPGRKLKKNHSQSGEDSALPYRELVGSLTYLASTTRPDISFAASYLGQFNNCFGVDHWKAAKRVLRYLKGTVDVGLVFSEGSTPATGYVDADWGNDSDDRRSFTGYIFKHNGGPIAWESRKQRTVALSTTEAEYMALSEGVKEALFLKRYLSELGFGASNEMRVYCDNQSSIKLSENDVFHGRSKHIDIRHHFVRDVVQRKEISLAHVSSENQVADFLTKALPKNKHRICSELAGLSDL